MRWQRLRPKTELFFCSFRCDMSKQRCMHGQKLQVMSNLCCWLHDDSRAQSDASDWGPGSGTVCFFLPLAA